MRIEVLYVPGCPNFQPAVERMEKVLVSESLRADIEGVPVNSDAEASILRSFMTKTPSGHRPVPGSRSDDRRALSAAIHGPKRCERPTVPCHGKLYKYTV